MTTELKEIHLTEIDFEKWEQGILTPTHQETFLSHTASCPYCAERWLAHMSRCEELLPQPPAYLAEEIMGRVHQPDVVVARKAHTTSKRMQLLLYSLKVGVALAASIYMIFALDAQTLEFMMNLW